MVKLFGPFPRNLLENGNPSVVQDIFDENGDVKESGTEKVVGLDERFAQIESKERTKFTAFVKESLTLDPKRLKSAGELLNEPWLKHEYEDDVIVE